VVISETTLGALAALGSAIAWAVTSLLARTLMAELGSVGVNAVRSTIGGVILVAWVLMAAGPGVFAAISTRAWVLLALSIVVAIALGDTVFFESSRALGLARAMTISTTYPLGAAAIAAVFIGEPLTVAIVVGALVTLGGLVLIVAPWAERPPEERFWFGVGMAAVASFAWALSTVLVKPPLAEMDAVTAQAIRLPLASAFLWLLPWARGAPRALALSGRRARPDRRAGCDHVGQLGHVRRGCQARGRGGRVGTVVDRADVRDPAGGRLPRRAADRAGGPRRRGDRRRDRGAAALRRGSRRQI
jgi:drug/metabolite transporter (DMT)-like permease